MSSTAVTTAVQKPSATQDFVFFYNGLNENTFLVQKCDECGLHRHPASPMCPNCHSLDWTAEPLEPTGTVYSYVIHYQPPYPDYPSPHAIALVDMAPDIRVLGALADCPIEDVSIGMEVRLEFVEHSNDFSLHRFRPAGAK